MQTENCLLEIGSGEGSQTPEAIGYEPLPPSWRAASDLVSLEGIEPSSTDRESVILPLNDRDEWWTSPASLRVPPACRAGALLIELEAHNLTHPI